MGGQGNSPRAVLAGYVGGLDSTSWGRGRALGGKEVTASIFRFSSAEVPWCPCERELMDPIRLDLWMHVVGFFIIMIPL